MNSLNEMLIEKVIFRGNLVQKGVINFDCFLNDAVMLWQLNKLFMTLKDVDINQSTTFLKHCLQLRLMVAQTFEQNIIVFKQGFIRYIIKMEGIQLNKIKEQEKREESITQSLQIEELFQKKQHIENQIDQFQTIKHLIFSENIQLQCQGVQNLFHFQSKQKDKDSQVAFNKKLVEAGLILVLIKLMHIEKQEALSRNLAMIIYNFSCKGQNYLLNQAGIVSALAKILTQATEYTRSLIFNILFNTSKQKPSIIEELVRTNIFPQILQSINRNCSNTQHECARFKALLVYFRIIMSPVEYILIVLRTLLGILQKNRGIQETICDQFSFAIQFHIEHSFQKQILKLNQIMDLLMPQIVRPNSRQTYLYLLHLAVLKLDRNADFVRLINLGFLQAAQSLLMNECERVRHNTYAIINNIGIDFATWTDELLKRQSIIDRIFATLAHEDHQKREVILTILTFIASNSINNQFAAKILREGNSIKLIMEAGIYNKHAKGYRLGDAISSIIALFRRFPLPNGSAITQEDSQLIIHGLTKRMNISNARTQLQIADLLQRNFNIIVEITPDEE